MRRGPRSDKKAFMHTARASTECATKLRVLGDPTRMRVVEVLMDGPRCVHELMSILRIEQSLLSHHLRILREAGFVVTRRDGRGVLYDLSPPFRSGRAGTLDLGCCAISFEARRE